MESISLWNKTLLFKIILPHQFYRPWKLKSSSHRIIFPIIACRRDNLPRNSSRRKCLLYNLTILSVSFEAHTSSTLPQFAFHRAHHRIHLSSKSRITAESPVLQHLYATFRQRFRRKISSNTQHSPSISPLIRQKFYSVRQCP